MPLLGPSTLNIGIIRGGRAPNVIPDEAVAEIFIRVVGDVTELRAANQSRRRARRGSQRSSLYPSRSPRLSPGFATTVVAYTTDIPAFGTAWGQPFLLGPGTIHVAHTSEERIAKSQLTAAVEIYSQLVERLSATMKRIDVGILGGTGMVGQHFIRFLQGHPWFNLTWLGASDRSAGKKLQRRHLLASRWRHSILRGRNRGL